MRSQLVDFFPSTLGIHTQALQLTQLHPLSAGLQFGDD